VRQYYMEQQTLAVCEWTAVS